MEKSQPSLLQSVSGRFLVVTYPCLGKASPNSQQSGNRGDKAKHNKSHI